MTPISKLGEQNVYIHIDESETNGYSNDQATPQSCSNNNSRSHFLVENYNNKVSKHRSCWLHMAACILAHQGKFTDQEAEAIIKFKSIFPCFLGFTRRQRSKRRVKKKLLVYCRRRKRKEITKRLDSSKFEHYFERMWRSLSDEQKNCFSYIDCLWFSLYLKGSFKTKVLSWIKRKHIFSKKYVFVPIVCWRHWRLLIFCHFGESVETERPCILLLDSLEMIDSGCLEPEIRKFVFDIFQSEGRQETEELIHRIPLLIPKVPQQTNGDECGMFVLYYMKLFMAEAPENFSISDGYPYFMKRSWFSIDSLQRFCNELDFL